MAGHSRQALSADAAYYLITIIWVVIIISVAYWFYRATKRIEKALLEIKKLLESKV